MEILGNLILIIHIAAGFIALALFWVQAYSRKGGSDHRKAGNLYVTLMWMVVVSALVLCAISFINGRNVIAIFLIFIALITSKPLWLGTAILKVKKEQSALERKALLTGYRRVNVVFNLLIVMAGIAMIMYGLYLGSQGHAILLMIFGGIGVINSVDLWSSIREFNSSDLSDWLKQHIAGMGASGIAAHTAFLVFGANRFLPEVITQSYWSFVPWLAPTLIGTMLIRIALTKYQPKKLEVQ